MQNKGIATCCNHVQLEKTHNITITAISDIHGHLPQMQPSCLAIVCGDIFPGEMDHNPNLQGEWFKAKFLPWAEAIDCEHVILVAGNHDCWIENNNEEMCRVFGKDAGTKLIYLFDNKLEFNGLKIYGTPWVPTPASNRAFSAEETELKLKYLEIPHDLDLLITHTVPLDNGGFGVSRMESHLTGSKALFNAISVRNIRCQIGGHIHSPKEFVCCKDFGNHKTILMNVACCDQHKRPIRNPVTFTIPMHGDISIR